MPAACRSLLLLIALCTTAASAQVGPRPHDGGQPGHGPGGHGGQHARAMMGVPGAPDTVVREGVGRLVEFLASSADRSPDAVRAVLEEAVAPHFDFTYMARWAAGPYARRLDDAQSEALGARLERMFLDGLARNLGAFTGTVSRVRVMPWRPVSALEAVVPARAQIDGMGPVRLEFRFYYGPDGWRIFDVAANGASAAAYYRRYFSDLLRRQGPGGLAE
ncbi:MAG: ABC transporter substrate-binding protein [Ectothiorhodospiraceae bacterium]|nr:ABC transporter substrate-binding protein [Chromatiales bacterium]MCP5155685.1 ABC transporter substrate-binding protein [Ectothiorhodospiraceae bacterium]